MCRVRWSLRGPGSGVHVGCTRMVLKDLNFVCSAQMPIHRIPLPICGVRQVWDRCAMRKDEDADVS